MTEAETETQTETLPVNYNVPDARIAELKAEFAGMTADDSKEYKVVSAAIKVCRDLRVKVEARRKEFKKDSLDYGRRIDKEAQRIEVLLREVEDPLKATKQVVDDEKARIKAEKEAAAQAIVDALNARITAIADIAQRIPGADVEALQAAIVEADWEEFDKEEFGVLHDEAVQTQAHTIDQLNKALDEREKFEIEKAETDKKQAEQEKEQAKLDAQRKEQEEAQAKIDAEKAEIEEQKSRDEFEAEAKETAEREAKEKLELEAKEKAEKDEAERLADQERMAARSDVQKLEDFTNNDLADCIREIPEMSSLVGKATTGLLRTKLHQVHSELVDAVNEWEVSDDG